MSDTRLIDTANSILDFLATKLATSGIDVPQRQYVHAGLIAHDFAGLKCADALIVSWLGTSQGQVGAGAGSGIPQAPIKCAMPLSHQYVVSLLRCVPVLQENKAAPSPAALSASATEVMTDAMTMAKVLVEGQLNSGVLPPTQVFGLLGIGEAVPIGPLGGVGGTQMSIWVTLY